MMKETINVTQAGRKLLQLNNQPVSPGKNTCGSREPHTSSITLPSLQNNLTKSHNHPLYFRLDQLYKANSLIVQAKKSFNHSVKVLEKSMLKDLGYDNTYTNKKAQELVSKLLNKSEKQAEKVSINMQISKNRNYLTRINYLHCEQNFKYGCLKKSLQNTLNKQNME